jgi:hypothetical protein
MLVTFQARGYRSADVTARYVRNSGGEYLFCEVGQDRRYDIRQGTVSGRELPDDVRKAADARRGLWPSYVEWPL